MVSVVVYSMAPVSAYFHEVGELQLMLNLIRPIFSITSHLTGDTYQLIQTDDGNGNQVLQIATNDADYVNSQIPGKVIEFQLNSQNSGQVYSEAIMALCLAVQKGIQTNALDAAENVWANTDQMTNDGLNSSFRNNGGNRNQNQGNRGNRSNQGIQVRPLVTN